MVIDLNFCEDNEIGATDYTLVAYPTEKLLCGNLGTETGIYQNVKLEII